MVALIAAINEGGIYKFLRKPVPLDLLKATLREAFLNYQRDKVMAPPGLPLERNLEV